MNPMEESRLKARKVLKKAKDLYIRRGMPKMFWASGVKGTYRKKLVS